LSPRERLELSKNQNKIIKKKIEEYTEIVNGNGNGNEKGEGVIKRN